MGLGGNLVTYIFRQEGGFPHNFIGRV